MEKSPAIVVLIIFLIGIIGLFTLVKAPQGNYDLDYYVTGEVVTGMQAIEWDDAQENGAVQPDYDDPNKKYCLEKDIPGLIFELENKEASMIETKKMYCLGKDIFQFYAHNLCDNFISSRCKGIGKIRGEQLNQKIGTICDEWAEKQAKEIEEDKYCEKGCCVCKYPLRGGNINELTIKNYNTDCSEVCKQIEKKILEQNFMNLRANAIIKETITIIPVRFIEMRAEWSTKCQQKSAITLPKEPVTPKKGMYVPPITESTIPVRTNPLLPPPLHTETETTTIITTEPACPSGTTPVKTEAGTQCIKCPTGAEPIVSGGIAQCQCTDKTKTMTDKGCFTCEELCKQKGMTTVKQDWNSHIMSVLNQPENACKQKVRIETKKTKISNCDCYSSSPPEIKIDPTPLVCKNTPCGDVSCGETKVCELGQAKATVSCKWGGWQMTRPGVFSPKIGASATQAS